MICLEAVGIWTEAVEALAGLSAINDNGQMLDCLDGDVDDKYRDDKREAMMVEYVPEARLDLFVLTTATSSSPAACP